MTRATHAEIEEAAEEKKYWQELANATGWRLYGWTYKASATYVSDPHTAIDLTGKQRDDIMRAIAQGGREGKP